MDGVTTFKMDMDKNKDGMSLNGVELEYSLHCIRCLNEARIFKA